MTTKQKNHIPRALSAALDCPQGYPLQIDAETIVRDALERHHTRRAAAVELGFSDATFSELLKRHPELVNAPAQPAPAAARTPRQLSTQAKPVRHQP